TATIDALGRRTSYSYNEIGLLTSKVSPSGAMTSYSYDAQGTLISIAEPSGAAWTFERDERGNLTRQINPLGEIVSFRTGNHGEILRLDLPNGAFRSIYFDRALRPAAFRDGRGFERRVSIDALGRVLSTTDQEGNTFVFDHTAGPDNPRGALRTLRLPDGTI